MNEQEKRLFLLSRFRAYEGSFRSTLYPLSQDIIIYAYEYLDEADGDRYEAVSLSMNDYLIYTEDLWEVMKSYQLPQKADLNRALEDYCANLAYFMELLDKELQRHQ